MSFPLLSLPNEILLNIFSNLDIESLTTLTDVLNKRIFLLSQKIFYDKKFRLKLKSEVQKRFKKEKCATNEKYMTNVYILAMKATRFEWTVMRPVIAFKLLKTFNGIGVRNGEKFTVNIFKWIYDEFIYHTYWFIDSPHIRYYFRVGKYYCHCIQYFNSKKKFDTWFDTDLLWYLVKQRLIPEKWEVTETATTMKIYDPFNTTR